MVPSGGNDRSSNPRLHSQSIEVFAMILHVAFPSHPPLSISHDGGGTQVKLPSPSTQIVPTGQVALTQSSIFIQFEPSPDISTKNLSSHTQNGNKPVKGSPGGAGENLFGKHIAFSSHGLGGSHTGPVYAYIKIV